MQVNTGPTNTTESPMTVAAEIPAPGLAMVDAAVEDEGSSRAAQQQEKLVALRDALSGAEGRDAAEKLVQGGELKEASELTSEPYLRRWLRARSWNVESAARSILAHAKWRVSMAPDGHVPKSEVANELAAGKAFMLGSDAQGRAVLLFQVRKHNAWARKLDELERFCCYLLDMTIEACDHSLNPKGHVSVILDLQDMGMMHMDLPAVKALFQLLGEHYVERLGQMVMWNPPTIFWGAWSTLSPLLPAVTLRKILVTKDPQALAEVVSPSILPSEYGGAAGEAVPLS